MCRLDRRGRGVRQQHVLRRRHDAEAVRHGLANESWLVLHHVESDSAGKRWISGDRGDALRYELVSDTKKSVLVCKVLII